MREKQPYFLEEIADKILTSDQEDLSSLCIILPTRRSLLYLRTYLLEKAEDRAFIGPDIVTFDLLLQDMLKGKIADKDELLIELYLLYKDKKSKYSIELDSFLQFAFQLLSDFDQINQNLIDAKSLFASLKEKETLDRWAEEFANTELISISEDSVLNDYFSFWQFAEELFFDLHAVINKRGQILPGQSFKYFLEDFKSLIEESSYKNFIVAGFNYLSAGQKEIINRLKTEFETNIYWDIDEYFYKRIGHEAGLYMRSHKSLGVEDAVSRKLSGNSFPDIKIYSNSNKVSQVKYAIDKVLQELSQLDYESDIKSNRNLISIIPADESLLPIILNSFPTEFVDKNGDSFEVAKHLNISLGRKLQDSSFYELIRITLDFYEKTIQGKNSFSYSKIWTLINQPLVSPFFNEGEIANIDFEVRKSNRAIFSIDELLQEFRDKDLLINLFKALESKQDLLHLLMQQIELLLSTDKISEDEKVFILKFKQLMIDHERLLKEIYENSDFKEFKILLLKIFNTESLPFSGEPIAPIQIIGLLETRALDFEFIHLLSCNEGQLPNRRVHNSLLPLDISFHFRLPTFVDLDASLSYTFYRLFYRSKRISLYYSLKSDPLNNAEPSRFLKQLELELLPQYDKSYRVEEVFHSFPTKLKKDIEIEKDPYVIQEIKNYLSGYEKDGELRGGLSASRLNTYIKSPLAFFKRTVLKVYESEELEEDINAIVFGNIVHKVLEEILQPYVNNIINKDLIKAIKAKIKLKDLIQDIAKNEVGRMDLDKGRNLILINTAELLINRYLDLMQNQTEFKLLGTEAKLSASLEVDGEKYLMSGSIDRLDLQGNEIQILDYKTGSTNNSYTYRELSDFWAKDESGKIIQLMFYKHLVSKNVKGKIGNQKPERIVPGFHFFREGDTYFKNLKYAKDVVEENADRDFEDFVKIIIQHMLNPEISIKDEFNPEELNLS